MDLKKYKKPYFLSLFKENTRIDSRKLDQYRNIKIKTGILDNAEGSAYVELGKTKVLAGIKLEVGEPFPDFPDEGVIITNLDLSPISEKNIPPELIPIEAELSRVVDRGLRESKAINTKKLCIETGKAVWIILVDLAVLDYDGNVIDAAGIATYLALKNAKFPKLIKEYDSYKIDRKELSGEIEINKVVLPISFAKIGDYLILDPNKEEEDIADVLFTISRSENEIHGLQKSKYNYLTKEEITKMLEISKIKFKELYEIINKIIENK